MKVLRYTLAVLLCCSTSALAAPATDASIKELLAVTQAQRLVDGIRSQFDSLLMNTVQQALKGAVPTANQQKAIDKMRNKVIAIMQEEFCWEKLEPLYLRLYKESFTEEEVAGILVFYKTPAGQAVINKLPALTQKTMLEVQQLVMRMNPQLQQIQQEFISDLSAESK